ncbi:lytic transglycosylase domain-containing protein [Chitinolyticbacter meiyuanensis]|uniref:lytic transglycosylase domain-containing protein n=1 Tax=Chitinolyticbacter meiyuanensis TaxID=682798 RepID=UPI001651C8BB|nr:lytic transglycosylase domain-containing protein [Chitinolyticbacter meiyuanensis]
MKRFVFALAFCSLAAQAAVDLDAVRDAAKKRDLNRLASITDANANDVLAMYPHYYWLSVQLPTVPNDEVRAFFARNDGSPLADKLRSEWLSEVGKRSDWDTLLAEYPKLDAPTTELDCYAAQANLSRGKREGALKLKALYLQGRAQPQSCGPVFDWLLAEGQLGEGDVWARIRDALLRNNTDFARQIAARVGNPAELQAKSLALAARDPVKALGGYNPARRGAREAALYAIGRLARSNPDAAAAWLENRTEGWPQDDVRFGWQQLGEAGAKSRHPQASSWFARGGTPQTASGRAWAIRAALRAKDVDAVLTRIDALPADEAGEVVWRYWKAQALKAKNRKMEADALLAALATHDEYYGQLATAELDTPIASANNLPYRPTETEIARVRQRPGVARALALFDGGWRSEAVREWNWSLRGLTDPELIAAAVLAERAGQLDRSIYAAERGRTMADIALRYPVPYRDEVERQALLNGIDAAWVFGLIRQESRFVTDARSRVGAGGLMQLMPGTAKWVAAKMGDKNYDPSAVHHAESNLQMGTFYLSYILERLEKHPVLATAGYNAGPGRARAWQDDQPIDAAIYIETIPFDETRDYVKKVLGNAQVYRYAFPKAPALRDRLAAIPPRGGAVDAP